MKKINFNIIKFIFIFIFVSAPLFLSLSNAEIEPNVQYYGWFDYRQSSVSSIGTYTKSDIYTALTKYINDDYSDLITIMNDLIDTNVVSRWYAGTWTSDGKACLVAIPYGVDAEMFHVEGDTNPYKVCFPNCTVSDYCWIMLGNALYENTSKGTKPIYNLAFSLLNPQFNIKELYIPTGSSGYYVWDGESYYYQSPSEPVSPTLPTNAEIAQAVQAFYNSDYYKNNKDFSDFMVLYNYDTQYFSFIGHNFGISLGQVIVPPDYEYEGYSYKQAWWKFFLRSISSELASNLWNRYYWLYSTNDFGQNITSVGKGSIKDLINLHFSTKSAIVYSTTDYRVVKIETDENGALSPVEGTIPGNQYTYDENLVPTENEYNPLENFVPVNPVDTALGNFGSSDILDIVNQNIISWTEMSWVFTSVSSLFNTFSSLLLLICVLLLISKIIGG